MSEPSQTIHLSGECLCGSYAKPGELLDIELFYPEVAKRIKDLQSRVQEAGLKHCEWGRQGRASKRAPGPMCVGCTAPVVESYEEVDEFLKVS